jgi:gliding motility-associated-like protein
MKTAKRGWLHCVQLLLFILFTTTVSAQLRADFSATPTSGCPPMVVSFKDSSSGNPLSWKWDLGNGTTSILPNPIGTYFNPGTYTVKLVVKNASGSDSIIRSKIIVVNALPVPQFGASDTTGCFPLTVKFKDSSEAGSGNITTWQWDFGDGTLSSQQNPSHTYTNAGNYNVTLKVANSNGCANVINKSSFIKLQDGVKADFSFAKQTICHTPVPISFTNLSTGTGALTYNWSFGDGNSSTQKNPINTYSNVGAYTVKLIATSSYGCTDAVIKSNAVNITTAKADFTAPASVCVGSSFDLINTSSPTSIAAIWNFGDGTTLLNINATKSYSKPGTYKIKLVNDFGACTDSVTKSIQVVSKPLASFTSGNTSGCAFPFGVSFKDNSTGATSYLWNFGDGDTSTLQNPTHTYTAKGNFTVTLIVTNAGGCSDTLVKPGYVNIIPPSIKAISNLGVTGCLPITISPVANIQANEPVTSYFWDFGDGSTSTLATPSHTYTTPGKFNVKLVITTNVGCTDSMVVNEAVKAGLKPVADFAADKFDVCNETPVNFTDLTKGKIDEWFWSFGDGGFSTQQNPIHQFGDTGTFTVKLVVYNFGCSDTMTKKDYIHIRPPYAKFDTAFQCSSPLTRNFIDQSKGAETWQWDFGDGKGTSTIASPKYTFPASGTYRVTLKVTNAQCSYQAARDVLVIDEKGKFTSSDSAGCANFKVTFDVSNANPTYIKNYTWFSEGITNNPIVTTSSPMSYTYTTAGTRQAAVILTNTLGCTDTLFTPVPVSIYGVKAGFKTDYPGTCFGNTINFTDTSATDGLHKIVEWAWDFGEGQTQIFPTGPFTHNYSAPGTYNVKMIIKDSYGCTDSAYKPAVITITKPQAGFSPSDTMLCPQSPVTFTNNSQGLNLNYNWSFGDGTTSSAQSPAHSYNKEGIFKVKLIISDKYGCKDSSSVDIQVFAAVADFSLSDSFSTCPPLTVNFTNLSAHYTYYNWSFGDGGTSQLASPAHIYTQAGTFTARLIVKNNGGCTDTLTRTIQIKGPTGVFNYDPLKGCTPTTVSFTAAATNTAKYIWDYNDGNTIYTTVPSSSYKYTSAGSYLPKLILEDPSGCRVPLLGKDTITVYHVKTNVLATTKLLCDSGIVRFSDSTITNDLVSSYKWNFGDGSTSVQKNPAHSFKDTGWYNITLITKTANGCADTATYKNYIKIVRSPLITILGDSAACEPAQLTFEGAFLRTDTSTVKWHWDFANGQQANVQKPVAQKYQVAGSYSVIVTATNSDGCTNTSNRSVIVHPKPNVTAGIDTTICKNNTYTLQANGASKYTWNTHPSLSCTTCQSPVAKPDSSMKYIVTGETIFGCTNTDTVLVKVKQPFKVSLKASDTLCAGQTLTLKASGGEVYKWSPSSTLSNSNIANPIAKPDSTITYSVIASDDHNCFFDTGYTKVKVYPIPTIQILNGASASMAVGGSLTLTTQSSPDVTKWKWNPTQTLSCTTCSNPVATPKDNTTYTVIASNDGNCKAKDDITINVICNNANVFVPNTFSPNGDGVNDIFFPRGSGVFAIRSLKVFNRWGQPVFEKQNLSANNPAEGWDGTINGQKAPSDVYVYTMEVVCENSVLFPFKGDVSLVR